MSDCLMGDCLKKDGATSPRATSRAHGHHSEGVFAAPSPPTAPYRATCMDVRAQP